MELHTAALFLHDERGRITGTNDGEPPGVAPWLYLGRTREGNVWRFRDDLPNDLVAELTDILETEPATNDLRLPPATLSRLGETLARIGPAESVDMGPAFHFPDEIPEVKNVVVIDRSHIDLVKERFPDHCPWLSDQFDIRQPITAVVRDGVAVSIGYSARMTPDAAEAGVDTAEEFRGQGFASAVTLAWAAAIRRMGRVPLYSTSWDNVASLRVANKLGLMIYGAELSIY
jgi:hypothetical protein